MIHQKGIRQGEVFALASLLLLPLSGLTGCGPKKPAFTISSSLSRDELKNRSLILNPKNEGIAGIKIGWIKQNGTYFMAPEARRGLTRLGFLAEGEPGDALLNHIIETVRATDRVQSLDPEIIEKGKGPVRMGTINFDEHWIAGDYTQQGLDRTHYIFCILSPGANKGDRGYETPGLMLRIDDMSIYLTFSEEYPDHRDGVQNTAPMKQWEPVLKYLYGVTGELNVFDLERAQQYGARFCPANPKSPNYYFWLDKDKVFLDCMPTQ